jgi:tetratricopeptide (TPR) repeat protein
MEKRNGEGNEIERNKNFKEYKTMPQLNFENLKMKAFQYIKKSSLILILLFVGFHPLSVSAKPLGAEKPAIVVALGQFKSLGRSLKLDDYKWGLTYALTMALKGEKDIRVVPQRSLEKVSRRSNNTDQNFSRKVFPDELTEFSVLNKLNVRFLIDGRFAKNEKHLEFSLEIKDVKNEFQRISSRNFRLSIANPLDAIKEISPWVSNQIIRHVANEDFVGIFNEPKEEEKNTRGLAVRFACYKIIYKRSSKESDEIKKFKKMSDEINTTTIEKIIDVLGDEASFHFVNSGISKDLCKATRYIPNKFLLNRLLNPEGNQAIIAGELKYLGEGEIRLKTYIYTQSNPNGFLLGNINFYEDELDFIVPFFKTEIRETLKVLAGPMEFKVAGFPDEEASGNEWLNRGRDLYQERDPKLAKLLLLKALDKDPNLAEVYYYLGKIDFEKRDYTQAANKFEIAINKYDAETEIWDLVKAKHLLAKSYARSGKPEKAIPAYKSVLEKDPDDETVNLDLGNLYLNELIDYENAEKYFQNILRKYSGDLNSCYEEFKRFKRPCGGYYSRGLNSTVISALYGISRLSGAQEKQDEQIEWLEKILAVDSDAEKAKFTLFNIYNRDGLQLYKNEQFYLAEKEFRKAIFLDPKNNKARERRAFSLLYIPRSTLPEKIEDIDKFIIEFETLLGFTSEGGNGFQEVRSSNADEYFRLNLNLTEGYLMRGNYEEARILIDTIRTNMKEVDSPVSIKSRTLTEFLDQALKILTWQKISTEDRAVFKELLENFDQENNTWDTKPFEAIIEMKGVECSQKNEINKLTGLLNGEFIALEECNELVFASTKSWLTAPSIFADADNLFGGNLSVRTVKVSNGIEAKNMVLTRAADIGIIAAGPLAVSLAQGEPIGVLGSYMKSDRSLMGMVSMNDFTKLDAYSKCKKPNNIPNKEACQDLVNVMAPIAIIPNTISEYYLYEYLKQKGLLHLWNSLKARSVAVKPDELAGKFKRQEINTAVIWEPYIWKIKKENPNIHSEPDIEFEFRIFLIANKEILSKKPWLVRKFIKAIKKSSEKIQANKNDNSEDDYRERIKNLILIEGDLVEQWKEADFSFEDDAVVLIESMNKDLKRINKIERLKIGNVKMFN